MEMPPMTMIHSPCGIFAAEMGRIKASANRTATRRNRFIMNFGAALFTHTPLSATRPMWEGPLCRDHWRSFPRSLHSRIDLVADQIFDRLTFANERDLVSAHQCLSRQWARIVIGCHDKSIGPRAHDRQQFAGTQFRHLAILGKKIAALTYRTNDVDLLRLGNRSSGVRRAGGPTIRITHRYDLVIALVKRWPDQIVHSSVDNREFSLRRFFDVKDARQQHSGVPNEEATGLDQNANTELAQRRHDRVGVIADTKCGWFAVVFMPPFT